MYQIGNGFTRFSPGIAFSEVPSFADSSDSCALRNVPASYETLHSVQLVNAWHAKLLNALTTPVQIEHRNGCLRVHVLGTEIFEFAANGHVNVYAWTFDENDRVVLKSVPAHTVFLRGRPKGALWMDRYKLGALRFMQQRNPADAQLCRTYVNWVCRSLELAGWSTEVHHRVQYQVAVAFDLDIGVLQIAEQIQRTALAHSLRLDLYNHVIRNRTAYQTLQVEAPQLIPLFALLAEVSPYSNARSKREVTAAMQKVVFDAGIQPATWRLLCREGTHWMKECLAFYRFDRFQQSNVALDLLKVIQAFGTEHLAPNWLVHAFLQVGGNPNAPAPSYARRLSDLFPLCARIGHLLSHSTAADAELLRERAQDIFNWASSHLKDAPEHYARRATVSGLIRRVEAQKRRDLLAAQSGVSWSVPYTLTTLTNLNTEHPDIHAVILDSPLAVWSEGQRMRHCAANYIAQCARGDWLMVSLRSKQQGRPVATVAFDLRSQRVSQRKIAGFANTLITPELARLVLLCQKQLQVQRSNLNLPLNQLPLPHPDVNAIASAHLPKQRLITSPLGGFMPACTLTRSDNYVQTLNIHPVETLPDAFELQIHSQLSSAKDPLAKHVLHRVIVNKAALGDLRDALAQCLGAE